jgi:octopine/nopaline transport system permease protein
MFDIIGLVGFGPTGWGLALMVATGMTLAVASCSFLVGAAIGALVAWAKLSGPIWVRRMADGYTTVLRGIPDLLVIYLFYFGGSGVLGALGRLVGADGFIGMPAFMTGALAVGIVSGAYQAEVFRGAYSTINRGEIEAAHSVGMKRGLLFRHIVAPLVLRFAIPGLGNTWQMVLKESALISVTGLIELMRQSYIAAGSTRRPFDFYIAAAALYLIITWVSTLLFQRAETRALRGIRRTS